MQKIYEYYMYISYTEDLLGYSIQQISMRIICIYYCLGGTGARTRDGVNIKMKRNVSTYL